MGLLLLEQLVTGDLHLLLRTLSLKFSTGPALGGCQRLLLDLLSFNDNLIQSSDGMATSRNSAKVIISHERHLVVFSPLSVDYGRQT